MQQEHFKKETFPMVGSWSILKDGTITEEHIDLFSKATPLTTERFYMPLQLIATQVVAGINYKFLCEEKCAGGTVAKNHKYVIIYRDLQGNCFITSVEDAKE